MLCVAALIVSSALGSQITMSASLPEAIVPFFGYIPMMRAGAGRIVKDCVGHGHLVLVTYETGNEQWFRRTETVQVIR